ncbi:M48 family metallopeptidase [Oerskovia flava]|uniref:M48 metallopeptidase family protein n=1 Tax=Oerskovia flava TaxID=2986422 RepID=UPI00223F80DC|nr:M48 family metallopeptidase [Oerskovia sp. JB1-3-2]
MSSVGGNQYGLYVAPDAETSVEVRRSRRRKSTVSAYRDGERTIVSIPARFTRAQEREWVQRMLDRLEDKERRRRPSDAELVTRAAELSAKYLDDRAHPTSVRWSSNQGRRWGSCTLLDGSIRISTRLQGMPEWVLDYVLLHELAHLLHAGHGPGFWKLLESYPRTERARGFLEGVSFGRPPDEPADPVADDGADGVPSGAVD